MLIAVVALASRFGIAVLVAFIISVLKTASVALLVTTAQGKRVASVLAVVLILGILVTRFVALPAFLVALMIVAIVLATLIATFVVVDVGIVVLGIVVVGAKVVAAAAVVRRFMVTLLMFIGVMATIMG